MALGAELAKMFAPPKLVLLHGDLGAGKTTLVKGIAEAFGAAVRDEVTSPTFTLVHEYRGSEVVIYHLDLYRVESERALESVGIDDLRGADALMLVEWGDKFPSLVRSADAEVLIEAPHKDDPDMRRVTVNLLGNG
ncbi:MAG: tRNA (adenosine(37)-N6)-threonylcarbamoyltransferase complex ATPase subunit type 1 TsaE [Acidobacteriaceae bacterium]